MPLNDAALNSMANHLASIATHVAVHTAVPDATGSNQSAAARQLASWAAAANGDLTLSAQEQFTGGASGGPATHLGLWSAATGGTFYGYFAMTGDQTFNAAGEYTVTAITIAGA